ncbi:MAG: AAA family ATPase [Betaproteobacteria bacterium]|nr:AAA family ATPase [Betaproteobacteria bacterium]
MTESLRKLDADQIGMPVFAIPPARHDGPFALSSHARAREALRFGLTIRDPDFNVFVVGEDRSGRMRSTLEFVAQAMSTRPPPSDWIYLNNFKQSDRPRPYRLPAGVGRRFRDAMARLVRDVREALSRGFSSEGYRNFVEGEGGKLRAESARRFTAIEVSARAHGLQLVQMPDGAVALTQSKASGEMASTADTEAAAESIGHLLSHFNAWMAEARQGLATRIADVARQMIDQSVGSSVDKFSGEFAAIAGIGRWLTELRFDMIERLAAVHAGPESAAGEAMIALERRYTVNLFVDRSDQSHPPVVLEPNPSYENLFGRIEYQQVQGTLFTEVGLLRAGSLHRANGGVLILRAEAIAADPAVWEFLKAAIRDREIRIEELHRAGTIPRAGAPEPKAVPLELRVILVGPPRRYQAFFAIDPDFQTYFKVKAEIDSDIDASPENIAGYAGLLSDIAEAQSGKTCDEAAVKRLLGAASRWAGQRDKLTARFEFLEDLIAEAATTEAACEQCITAEAIDAAVRGRRYRRAHAEDRNHEAIRRGVIMIATQGRALSQVNALAVRDTGDHAFGLPARVTARASVGRRGIVNIERDVSLGGPIQQKGAFIIQGWLAGTFARANPLSATISLTFEQTYGGVEGDSASMAELIAILSDLSGVPVRQDLAITGAVNQLGLSQAIGGVHHKIEGFFRTCREAGPLTGTQGVIVPRANEPNLVLSRTVSEAVRTGQFHVWSVAHVEDAIALMLDAPVGIPDARGDYPHESVFGRVAATLARFERALDRVGARDDPV